MTATRRRALALGGGVLAALAAPGLIRAREAQVIEMRGTARGERVWFAPLGLAAPAGAIIRFINRDPVNSHTATAYHPANFDRRSRMPAGAAPWDSGFLLPGEMFQVTLEAAGVYDYYCLPHEHAGMVGRIVVGSPASEGWRSAPEAAEDIPAAALAAFPPVAEILRAGSVFREETS